MANEVEPVDDARRTAAPHRFVDFVKGALWFLCGAVGVVGGGVGGVLVALELGLWKHWQVVGTEVAGAVLGGVLGVWLVDCLLWLGARLIGRAGGRGRA